MTIIDRFKIAKDKQRLSHLYLLSGKVGLKKLDLAYNISHLILKDYDKRDNLLELIKTNNHTQIFYIKPEGSVIKKSQILLLQEEFSKTSLINAPRIYIIEDVDVISLNAANSLLKFMEEPESENVYGIIITSNISNVLKTIVSRAQVIRVYDKENVNVYEHLINEGVSSYLAKMISFITNNYSEADDLSSNDTFIKLTEFIHSYFYNYNERSLLDLNEISLFLVERDTYHTFLELLLINYNELLKYKNINKTNINEIINENTKNININNLLNNINLIKKELIKQSSYININLSLEVLMINLIKEV